MKLKTILFAALILTISLACYAGSPEKEYKKIVEKYDVPPEAKGVNPNDPSAYWHALLNNNDLLVKFANDMKKGKGAEKEAFAEVAKIPKFNAKYNSYICDEMQGFCDTLLMNMGISGRNPNCSLHIVYDDEVNAFTALTDEGFAMCITSGFITKKGCTYEMIMAVVAHEFAHGAYFHHLQTFYAQAKKKRKNELIGGIVGGLSAFNEGYSKARGIEPTSNVDMNKVYSHLNKELAKYTIKFGREEEFEADIVAFRFMQWIGQEEAFIELMNFLGTDYDVFYDEYSDHPKTTDRIGLAQYIKSHPEIKNMEIEKIRKKNKKGK